MPSYRGNVGNLLQHWVLCEVLAACGDRYDRVTFIDAHSMAPLADQRPKRDATANLFDEVRGRLPGERTPYEKAWLELAPNSTAYPNSARFLTAVWLGRYTMLLCESDPETVQQLELWRGAAERSPHCNGIEVAPGDWRNRFVGTLPPSTGLSLLSFDPYMFDRHGLGRNPGNMDPTDLDRVAHVSGQLSGGLIVQLSTYSANNDNAQAHVRDVVSSHLANHGLDEVAVVRADGNMMSLVFARDVSEGRR